MWLLIASFLRPPLILKILISFWKLKKDNGPNCSMLSGHLKLELVVLTMHNLRYLRLINLSKENYGFRKILL